MGEAADLPTPRVRTRFAAVKRADPDGPAHTTRSPAFHTPSTIGAVRRQGISAADWARQTTRRCGRRRAPSRRGESYATLWTIAATMSRREPRCRETENSSATHSNVES
jgi:hypothetical protein